MCPKIRETACILYLLNHDRVKFKEEKNILTFKEFFFVILQRGGGVKQEESKMTLIANTKYKNL